MNHYAQIDPSTGICVAVSSLSGAVEAQYMIAIEAPEAALLGKVWDGQGWQDAPPAPVAPDPTKWLIDVGPFFDRFGVAKLAVLSSGDAMVRALVTDLQVRKWIDLQRADVAAGVDLLIAKAIPGVDASLKTAILTAPVAPEENLALRKTYFAP